MVLSSVGVTSYKKLVGNCYILQTQDSTLIFPFNNYLSFSMHLLRFIYKLHIWYYDIQKGLQVMIFCHVHHYLQLKAFSDSNWSSYINFRKSLRDFCVFLGDDLISWNAKKQQIVSRFSSEARCRALVVVTHKLEWM